MNNFYVRIPAIYKKLKTAEKNRQIVYLSAPVGYGKTAALRYYFRNKAVLWLSGETGDLDFNLALPNIKQSIVIIDDITWLTDEKSREYVLNLIHAQEKLVILSGRAKLPDWLRNSCISSACILADCKDLELDEGQTEKLLMAYNVMLPMEQIQQIRNDSRGHALFIIMIAYRMHNQSCYTEVVREAARMDAFHYYDEALYEKWNVEMRELLMAVSNFPVFTVELAEMVTGNKNAMKLLELAMTIGDFLTKHEDGTYEMIPMLVRYLQWKQKMDGRITMQSELYERAAIYYEMNEQISEALACFEKAGNTQAISKLLIRNANLHPGTGHYFETRKYYLELTEDTLVQSPTLMAGISMLYSLLMQPKKSEYWYDQLKQYELTLTPGIKKDNEKRKEVRRRILYLDIALPHRGAMTMIDTLRYGAAYITDRKMTMPEFSVTSNLPSIMNGGKDFCEWSKKDKELAIIMKKPIELMIGNWCAGLVNIALAESLFEKGETDTYEVISLLNSGYTKADLGGKIEMCFVATAVLSRIHVCHRQLLLAKSQLKEFEGKARKEEAQRLLPNIYAMYAWFALLDGDTAKAKCWLSEEAPNELQEFYILNRYQYLMKVRVYLALEQYEDALNLIDRLSIYFREYHRTYMNMENEILRAVLFYRRKQERWKKILTNVLQSLQEYHFLYLIAKEGAAIWPLLVELLSDSKNVNLREPFVTDMKKAVYEMAVYYPKYLKYQPQVTEQLTEVETQILQLHCQGMDSKKICEQSDITYNTLKFHNKNIYRKLGVTSKQEAIRKANELGKI